MGGDPELEKQKAWGLLTSLDLHECDPEIIENEKKLKKYLIEVCDLIDMKRFGEPNAVYFGSDPKVKGYSIYQLIETSMISGHFGLNPGGKTGYGYIDIFSCKGYDTDKAAEFTRKYFKAKTFNKSVIYRRYWFEEKLEAEKGRGIRIEITKKIVDEQSKFQHIELFETKAFGKMLVLDNAVQTTEMDEAAYHEMITHVPMNTHPNPKKALVIGGGDGGILRELARYSGLTQIDICELDGEVIRVCKEHLPKLAIGFEDPRVRVHLMDGAEFVKNNKGYDVIIVDSPDPIGPAQTLFTKEFYTNLREALSEDGILVTQSESMYYHQELIERLSDNAQKLFPVYRYYYALVPTYPSGVIGFSLCSKKWRPVKNFSKERAEKIKGLRYYTPGVHVSAFELPVFIRKKVYKKEYVE